MFTLFLVVATVQLIFWYVFFGCFTFRKTTLNNIAKEYPKISVIICARNEASNLQKNLAFILSQNYPCFEVIVIDDQSEDESSEILKCYQQKNIHLSYFRIHEKKSPGKKEALLYGVEKAKYDWILLTDADCRPFGNNWIRVMSAALKPQTEIVLGYAPYKTKKGFLNSWIRYETIYSALQYFSAAFWKIPYMGVGRNLLVKKTLYKIHKTAFSENTDLLSGDDDLFVNSAANSINTEICLNSESFVISEPKTTLKALFIQKFRHFSSGIRYKSTHKIILGLLNLSHVSFWLLFFILAFSTVNIRTLLILLLIRQLVIQFIFFRLSKVFKEKVSSIFTFLFDFLLTFYYILFASVLFKKNRRWK